MNLGIVAKIDLSEIRAPFIEAALSGLGVSLLVVFFGSVVFWKISEPMIRHIRDREARLSAILNTAIEGIITINTQGIIESVNPAAEEMFGYTSSEMIGRNVRILMPSPFQEEHDGYLARYLETGVAKIICIGREVVALRKDGSTFPAELAVSEVGHLEIYTGVIRDVTERKETEAKIMQVERLSAIGEAMTGLMHESRNALQRSQASLERLARRVRDRPEVIEFIDDLQEAQDDLHRLYEEVREFAAPIKIKPKRCRLDEIVRQAWDNLEPMHNGRHVRLQEHGLDVNLHCNVDEFEIRQVFRNILENGIGACPDPGKIEVQYSETKLGDSPAVCIATRNNGPPFTPDEQTHIFDAFFTTKTHGTGLGMAIVKRIVDAHGGHVVLGPDPDRIAEILITLPRNSS